MTIDMQCKCGGDVKGEIDFQKTRSTINVRCEKCGREIKNKVFDTPKWSINQQTWAILYLDSWLAGADDEKEGA